MFSIIKPFFFFRDIILQIELGLKKKNKKNLLTLILNVTF